MCFLVITYHIFRLISCQKWVPSHFGQVERYNENNIHFSSQVFSWITIQFLSVVCMFTAGAAWTHAEPRGERQWSEGLTAVVKWFSRVSPITTHLLIVSFLSQFFSRFSVLFILCFSGFWGADGISLVSWIRYDCDGETQQATCYWSLIRTMFGP